MAAYYNEIEPFAVDWLRNLIARGVIAPGDVDGRSIRDVQPQDLRGYTQCHFFAGIGVWSHALRLAGWPDDEPVWTGSCPCQPFSVAGKRKGQHDDRHLWPEWFRLIAQRNPPVVFGEQVASPDGLHWLDAVSADMEGAGYAIGASDLPAAGVGAPHKRQRLWFVADTEDGGRRDLGHAVVARESGHADRGVFACDVADIEYGRCEGRHEDRSGSGAALPRSNTGGMADTANDRCDSRPGAGGRHGQKTSDGCLLGDTAGARRQGLPDGRDAVHAQRQAAERAGGDASDLAHGDGPGQPPAGWRVRTQGRNDPWWSRATGGFWSDADWIWCRDEKYRPVEPGTFPLVDGAPGRVGRLRAYGNAIVAPVAAEFIAAYQDSRLFRVGVFG